MSDMALWARRLERERRARKEAETLLERLFPLQPKVLEAG